MSRSPPFSISPIALTLLAKIERLLGQVDASVAARPAPQLRKKNRIRTIKDSLAIEGNTLSLEQVTAIFENKKVLGPKREILEVQNAIQAYDAIPKLKSSREKDFRRAHGILMNGLLGKAGAYRTDSVGVLKGQKISHVAPPPRRLPELMENLFKFISNRTKLSPLILSAAAHYEIEFIHPFADGNGRMGRLWQHLILHEYHSAFAAVPFDSLIKENQVEYYEALEKCDHAGDSTLFVEFSLRLLAIALHALLVASPKRRLTIEERLEIARSDLPAKSFTRKDYMGLFPGISGPTASRDLQRGLRSGDLRKTGMANKTIYSFKNGKTSS